MRRVVITGMGILSPIGNNLEENFKSLQEGKCGIAPPTVNFRVADEVCDLDIVANVGRKQEILYAMTNSLGFGGHNASIIIKKY